MKKVLKWAAILLLTPILLFLLLALLLYFPPVQNWAVKKVAMYASEKTGMDISVGHVALRFPLDLTLDEVKVIKDNDSIPGLRDTIADVGRLYANVQLRPLFDKKVEVDALELEHTRLNTNGFIPDLRVKGNVESLQLKCHGIDLKESMAQITSAKLDSAKLEICLADTVPPDTTETTNPWRIRLDDLQLSRADVTVRMPGDTLRVRTYLSEATATDGYFDLGEGDYRVSHLSCAAKSVEYDNQFMPPADGLDTNHLNVTDLALKLDSIQYRSPKLDFSLQSCSLREKSGIQIDELSGKVSLDSAKVRLANARLKTPDSQMSADIDMDLNTFETRDPGKMYADVDGYLGKQDLMRFMGSMPTDFVRKWPNQPLAIKGRARGNMERLEFQNLHASLPTAFQMAGDGYVANLTDPDRLKADVHLKGVTSQMDFVASLLDKETASQVNIPQGISLDGHFKANGHRYGADFTASEGGGNMKANVALDTDLMKYSATVDADRFPIHHFLPKMGLSPLTAHIEADGQGTDMLSPKTTLRAKAKIGKFRYGQYDLDGMTADALLSRGMLQADIDSHNSLLNGHINLNALMDTKRLKGVFEFDLSHADFYSLHLSDMPMTLSGCAHLEIDTDMKDTYMVAGSMGDLSVMYKNIYYKPDDMSIDILTRPDTTYAKVFSGDFKLDMYGSGGYKRMLSQAEHFTDELTKQMRDKHFDQALLRKKLPDANIYLSSGHENFFVDLLEEEGYSFKNLLVDMTSSHVDGLNGLVRMEGLKVDSILLDEVRFNVLTDSTGFKYNGQVINGPDHPQYTFNAQFDGAILEKGANINAKLYDKDERLGVDVGVVATIEQNGVRAHLTNVHPILGYIPFTANEDNYVFLGDDRRLSANLNLQSDDGMHMILYTNDDNREALQDLTLSISKINLKQILSYLPYMPDVGGIADGDFHIVQTEKDLSVSSLLSVDALTYDGMLIGNLSSEFVYMPNEDGSHYIDGVLYSDGDDVGTIVGTYNPKGDGNLDASVKMDKLPLSIINSFIPDQIIGFDGYGHGQLTLKGSLKKPDVNGEVLMEDASLVSVPYGVKLNVDKKPLRIVGSNVVFEDFCAYDANRTPMTLNGYFDFSDFDNMKLDLRMRANNFQVINAKENLKSEAYGKAFVNFFGSMRGPLDALSMRGRVDVLGSTDMTYVMRDTPLTADTRMDELVRFVDFNDSTEQVVARPVLSGFNMDLTINVDEGARIKCDLVPDHSNYIDMMGGGDLRMSYNSVDNLRLVGRYQLSNSEMKYSLPIIPLKTFTIQEGSYIEFKGDPMNPVLHITATEERKATVEDEGGGTRSVNFHCGVDISQTLNDMGLEFIIEAPEDVTIGTELASMTTEERGKVAVTMLTTGMYLADGNTSGFTMNGALSSFLQSEINNLAGNALRTLDLSVGVDNATDASGAMHTDYSFKFAKRFWNNRLRVVIGGKVSTGSEAQSQNQSFFTNVAFEYRLNATSNKYLKLFYDRDAYDWLEGEIGEYGGGFLWRRKLQHFSDILRFKNDCNPLPQMPMRPRTARTDSLAPDTIQNNMRYEKVEK